MTEMALRVEGISKQYQLGVRERYRALRDILTNGLFAPATAFKRRKKKTAERRIIWALRDVSFDVRQGEIVGIIGRNGAGKSTLLKILARITEPTEGQAFIRGRVGALLEVGTGFHPELTGRENVYLNGAILGMRQKEVDRKFDEIVSFAEIERFVDTPVKHYSSGMYMRLAFSVAAHLEPETLFVDEVLAVGDLQFQKKCLGKMHDVSRGGRTVLFVSHNLSAITTLCSRALLLREGSLVNDGRPEDVVAGYLASALGASATAEWSRERAPGTGGFLLRDVRLLDENGAPASLVDAERPYRLCVGYDVDVPNFQFRVCARFHTQGICAFLTLEPGEVMHERPGRYESSVIVPANMFAELEYTVGVSVFSSKGKKVTYCLVNDVIAFQVFDAIAGTSARGDYAEATVGVMRPLLQWETHYAGDRREAE